MRRLISRGIGTFLPVIMGFDRGEKRMIKGHTLYYFEACPFCFKVRKTMKRLGIDMERKNLLKNPDFRTELIAGGGKKTVPCLKIGAGDDAQWMYESKDIIQYLETQFS
jgi:glutathione S-transferase